MTKSATLALVFACLGGAALSASAHNGARAIAYPIDGIDIDGDASDWPDTLTRYAIAMNAPDARDDFRGEFRVGYDLGEKSLYVVVDIEDDDHRVSATADLSFLSQDTHLLYLDAAHDPRGSGVSTYELSENSVRKVFHTGSWDPRIQPHGLSNVRAAARRHGRTMTYEWRLYLGDKLKPNKTIGLDHEVIDVDADDTARVSWGLFQYKSSLSNNLGDVFIASDGDPVFGTLEGTASLAAPFGDTVPYGLEITRVDHPALWTQIPLLRNERYSIELPPGRYQIRSALIGNVTSADLYLSSDGDPGVVAVVESGKKSEAPPYRVLAAPEPALVTEDQGVLLRSGDIPADQVDTFFEKLIRFYAVPGLNLALIKNGNVAYEKNYGYSNAFARTPVAQDALFDSGSLTKPVFATLVMKLAEQGIIDLDRPLHQYLAYDDIAHDDAYRQITARHVLTHRTGFPNWRRGQLNFVNPPGTFGYSGEGFVYLSKVIEAITQEDVDVLLRKHVTEPLGMDSTYFSANNDLRRRLVFGHNDKYSAALQPAPSPNMAYSMHTNATDFSTFILGILNGSILSESTVKQMFSDQVDIPTNWSEANTDWRQAFGLGFQLKHSPYGFAFGHSGRNGGYDCTFEVYSEADVGYVFFTNSSNGFRLKNVVREFLISGRRQ